MRSEWHIRLQWKTSKCHEGRPGFFTSHQSYHWTPHESATSKDSTLWVVIYFFLQSSRLQVKTVLQYIRMIILWVCVLLARFTDSYSRYHDWSCFILLRTGRDFLRSGFTESLWILGGVETRIWTVSFWMNVSWSKDGLPDRGTKPIYALDKGKMLQRVVVVHQSAEWLTLSSLSRILFRIFLYAGAFATAGTTWSYIKSSF